jgi:hypothetical protein
MDSFLREKSDRLIYNDDDDDDGDGDDLGWVVGCF